ncbi:MAG TPA: 2-dehydropantoate 2-reductase [Actinomycetota bacterium]|jgi:2-dehydropantoate 2-reductase|nr:2-dehydropantoate 2-reductase [Actinomycetota bacterium]
MRIAVFGAGGVGGYLGARLAQAGEDVVFIARGEHLRAIREHGLRLESIAGDALIQPAEATDDPSEISPVDAVIVATKTWDLPAAAKAMRPLVGPQTAVVPVLNGVEAPAILTESLGPEPVLGGLTGMVSFIAGPGHIRHAGAEPWIAFGELDGRVTDRVRRLEESFRRCRGLKVDVPADINEALWEKFMFITATGGVGAVTRAPFGVFRSIPETRGMLEAAMREVVAVARARGVDVPDDAVTRGIALIDGLEPHGSSSMQRDIMAGQRSELDAWNGAVVRLGSEAGVGTPVHEYIYATLLPQERRARGEIEFPEG